MEEKKKKTYTKKAIIAAGIVGFVVGVEGTRRVYHFLEDNVPYSYRGSLSDIYQALVPINGTSGKIYTTLARIERKIGIDNTFTGK